MLIPVGDDLKKESVPVIGMLLIAANILVGMYELRLWQEGMPKPKKVVKQVDADPWAAFREARPAPRKPVISVPWMDFIKTWGLTAAVDKGTFSVRYLTHMFLHGDLAHLLGNLLTMWVFLPTLEAALGRLRFLILYVMSGIAGGIAHCLVLPGSEVPMIGASGAISGMVGAYFVAFGGLARITMAWNGGLFTGWRWVTFRVPAGIYVFFWLILPQVVAAEFAVHSGQHMGVAWFAHAGGVAMGLVFTLIQRSDILENLHYSREGKLTIGETEETRLKARQLELAAEQRAHSSAASTAHRCMYCQSPLAAAEAGNDLVRCGNPSCGMLNLLELPASSQPTAALAGQLHR